MLSECDRKGGSKSSLTSMEIGALGHSLMSTLKAVRKVFVELSKLETKQIFLMTLANLQYLARN